MAQHASGNLDTGWTSPRHSTDEDEIGGDLEEEDLLPLSIHAAELERLAAGARRWTRPGPSPPDAAAADLSSPWGDPVALLQCLHSMDAALGRHERAVAAERAAAGASASTSAASAAVPAAGRAAAASAAASASRLGGALVPPSHLRHAAALLERLRDDPRSPAAAARAAAGLAARVAAGADPARAAGDALLAVSGHLDALARPRTALGGHPSRWPPPGGGPGAGAGADRGGGGPTPPCGADAEPAGAARARRRLLARRAAALAATLAAGAGARVPAALLAEAGEAGERLARADASRSAAELAAGRPGRAPAPTA